MLVKDLEVVIQEILWKIGQIYHFNQAYIYITFISIIIVIV